jgi:hypothetical protein
METLTVNASGNEEEKSVVYPLANMYDCGTGTYTSPTGTGTPLH